MESVRRCRRTAAVRRSFIEADNTTVEHDDRLRRRYIAAGAAVVVALVAIVGFVLWVGGRLNDAASRVASAQQQVVATTRLANEEVRAARDDANRQIAEARQLAQRAETVSAVLTAPDLIRFNLTSTLADGSSAQVLWSRSRGVVLSGSRLPGPGPEKTYQLWLVTNGPSVSAGVFEPDSTGRATLVVDPPPKVPGPVDGRCDHHRTGRRRPDADGADAADTLSLAQRPLDLVLRNLVLAAD